MLGLVLQSTSVRQVKAIGASAVILGAFGLVNLTSTADALSCTSRITNIRTAYPSGGVAQEGEADNSGCSGGGSYLGLKILEEKTAWFNDEVAYTQFYVTGSHDRVLYACDKDDGQFFARQSLNGNDKNSIKRSFKDCYLK